MPSRCCVVIEWESSEARRTECRYMAVDPDNRLIASSLEADWEKRSASWKRQRPILKRWSQGLRRVLPRRMSGEWQSIVPQLIRHAATLSDIAVLVRAGARWHIAVLAKNSVSRYEHVSGTIDQPVTGPGHILAMNGVVALHRPVAVQIAVVDRGSSVTTMRVVNACGRNAHRAKPGEEPGDPEACHGRQAFVERHGALHFSR